MKIARLIDADELFKDFENAKWYDNNDRDLVAEDILMDAPTVDTVKTGYNKACSSLFDCSECGWTDCDTYTGDTTTYNYCPNCGAKMDKEAERD